MESINLSEDTFSFIEDYSSRACILNGCYALNTTEMWDWLKNFEPNPLEGFMFSRAPELNKIFSVMDDRNAPWYCGHSGGSMGWTMRQLHFLAKNGLEEFKNAWVSINYE